MNGGVAGHGSPLVILAGGRAKRYGGPKPLAPVGPHGEAIIDLVGNDARAAGFGTIVIVIGPATGPAIRYHVEHTWPGDVDVRFAEQPAPLGTVHAVLCATEYVAGAPYGVGNADDIYGVDGCRLLAAHLHEHPAANALVGYRLVDAVIGRSPVTRGICRVSDDGTLLAVEERRQVTVSDEGRFVVGDGRDPATLSPDARVSMNLWGFTPAFHEKLQAAMAASVDASEEREVLLPEVVSGSLGATTFRLLAANGKCVGVTHPDDLPLVQAELNRQVATGERPAGLWPAFR